MTATFDLRALTMAAAEDLDTPDPVALAALVLTRIKPAQNRAALQQALATYCQQFVSRERMHNRLAPAPAITAADTPNSWYVTGCREGWKRALRNQVRGPEGFKSLADCTREDLLYAASSRRTTAARYADLAESYEALADLLARHKKAVKVGDLPTAVLAVALGGVAA